MPEYALGMMNENDYTVIDEVLYTLNTPAKMPEYPRLVLPKKFRKRVILRAHNDVAHQSVRKTLTRIQEVYKWDGQLKDVIEELKKCGRCIVHRRKQDHPTPGKSPIAQYPFHFASVDLSGPYPATASGHKYLLSYMDHYSGWVESIPLKTKTAAEVCDVFL